jgi:hypothetical protein
MCGYSRVFLLWRSLRGTQAVWVSSAQACFARLSGLYAGCLSALHSFPSMFNMPVVSNIVLDRLTTVGAGCGNQRCETGEVCVSEDCTGPAECRADCPVMAPTVRCPSLEDRVRGCSRGHGVMRGMPDTARYTPAK